MMHTHYLIEWEDGKVGFARDVPPTTVEAHTYGELESAVAREAAEHLDPDPDFDVAAEMVLMPDGRFYGLIVNGFKVEARYRGTPT